MRVVLLLLLLAMPATADELLDTLQFESLQNQYQRLRAAREDAPPVVQAPPQVIYLEAPRTEALQREPRHPMTYDELDALLSSPLSPAAERALRDLQR